jgi:hypothetical protein
MNRRPWTLGTAVSGILMGTFAYIVYLFPWVTFVVLLSMVISMLGISLAHSAAHDLPESDPFVDDLPPGMREGIEELGRKLAPVVNGWGMDPFSVTVMRELSDPEALVKMGMPHTATLIIITSNDAWKPVPKPKPEIKEKLSSNVYETLQRTTIEQLAAQVVPRPVIGVKVNPGGNAMIGVNQHGRHYCTKHTLPDAAGRPVALPSLSCLACGLVGELNG